MTPSFRNRAAGLSLIELMVTMIIGLIMMLAVVQIFISSRAASQLSEGAARSQENARFAIDFLERDIRMAGHFGCVNDQAHFVRGQGDPILNFTGVNTGDGSPLDFSVAIQGYEAEGTAPGDELTIGGTWSDVSGAPGSITGLSPAPRAGSDILVLRHLSSEGVPVTAITPGDDSVLTVDATRWARLTEGGVASPTLFGIADCSNANVFAGTTTAGTITATGANLGRFSPYPDRMTQVYRAESLVYYVAESEAGNGEPALFRARADGAGNYTSEELVEGIESLQLMYGLDDTVDITPTSPPVGNITSQAIASDVSSGADEAAAAQWRRVGSVRVGILARSPFPAAAQGPVEQVARQKVLGVEFAPPENADRRFRTSYEVNVALRNRLFGN